jgi:hypothetical protein
VAAVSREYRSLGRALRPGPVTRRRPLLARVAGWLVRHLPEIVLVLAAVRAWQFCAAHIGARWTALAAVLLVTGALSWRRSRRWLAAAAGCALTRARLRAAFAELALCRRNGRLPLILAVIPTPVGERGWLICPVGVSAEDIADEGDRLRAACIAREVRITRDRRFAALVAVDVIRRDPLAASRTVDSPLGRRTADAPPPPHPQER